MRPSSSERHSCGFEKAENNRRRHGRQQLWLEFLQYSRRMIGRLTRSPRDVETLLGVPLTKGLESN